MGLGDSLRALAHCHRRRLLGQANKRAASSITLLLQAPTDNTTHFTQYREMREDLSGYTPPARRRSSLDNNSEREELFGLDM